MRQVRTTTKTPLMADEYALMCVATQFDGQSKMAKRRRKPFSSRVLRLVGDNGWKALSCGGKHDQRESPRFRSSSERYRVRRGRTNNPQLLCRREAQGSVSMQVVWYTLQLTLRVNVQRRDGFVPRGVVLKYMVRL